MGYRASLNLGLWRPNNAVEHGGSDMETEPVSDHSAATKQMCDLGLATCPLSAWIPHLSNRDNNELICKTI